MCTNDNSIRNILLSIVFTMMLGGLFHTLFCLREKMDIGRLIIIIVGLILGLLIVLSDYLKSPKKNKI